MKQAEKDLSASSQSGKEVESPSSPVIEKFIYSKDIVSNPGDSKDRYIVIVERRLSSHWIVVEADVPPNQMPQRFTVSPHSDLVPYGSEFKDPDPKERVNLNQCTETELLLACPGLGVCAHVIVDRRPKTLYTSIAQVKQLNMDLNIDWAGFQRKVELK